MTEWKEKKEKMRNKLKMKEIALSYTQTYFKYILIALIIAHLRSTFIHKKM